MSIPKILHQTWKDKNVPKQFEECVASWKTHHPDWEYRLWTDRDNRELIAARYPGLLETYDRYPAPIQRADAVRYCILHRFGGMYVDLDFISCRPIEPLLEGRHCVLGVEPTEHCRHFKLPQMLCNALMAAVPSHPFFTRVIEELPNAADRVEFDQPVLSSTGPIMISRVYEAFADRSSMEVLPEKYLYPLSLRQTTELRITGHVDADLSESFAIHLFHGSWRKTNSWDRLWRAYYKLKLLIQWCGRLIRRGESS
ncbi:MAG: cell surface protein [Fuerstiella sp.]|nr:cell surface protein [Fuerstiella sp.]MCP4856655.1 cell surface protein [Fuerstiella sp.]